MRHWIWGLLAVLALIGPLTTGYFTAPCDALTGRPVPLSPYRLQQQRFLDQSAAALAAMARLAPELHRVADAAAPASMAAAFQRAGQVSNLAGALAQIPLAEPPPLYALLGERLGQTRDTYALAAEQLLDYLGNQDATALQAAQAALALADTARRDLDQAVSGLRYPLCREVWAHDRR